MQTFKQKQIALAVGAAMLAMAGVAQAAVAPAARAANPALHATAGLTDTQIRTMMSTVGLANTAITIDVALNTGAAVAIPAAGTSWTAAVIGAPSTATVVSTAGLAVGMAVTSAQALFPADAVILTVPNATTFTFQSATTAVPVSAAGANAATATAVAATVGGNVATTGVAGALTIGNATPANNNVIVYTGTTATPVPSAVGATAVLAAALAGGVSHVTISLPAPGATAAYRVNGATGALEYTADNTVAAPVWAAVKVDVQDVVAGTRLYTDMDNVAGFNGAATPADIVATAIAGLAAGNSVAPTPVVSTTSAAGAALVNGFSIDTGATIALTNANLAVKTRTTATAFPAAALPAAPTCVAATATTTAACTVTFVGLGTLATAADFAAPVGVDAGDVTFYNSTNFNTGVINATVPWTVDGVNAAKASYTNVFNVTDGVAAKLANVGGVAAGDAAAFPAVAVVSDGAQVTLVKAESTAATGTTTLNLTFSEPMSTLVAAGDLREVAENVLVGTNSLAALNLNAGGTLALVAPSIVSGQGVVGISGVQAADLVGQTLNIKTGIALKEPNDTGYSATVAALDNTPQLSGALSAELAGGLAATTGATDSLKAASATAAAITAVPVSIAFGTDTTARAYTAAADATKVDRIVVSFAAGKEIALNAAPAKTLADLAADTVVTVTGQAGQTPIVFQFHPTAAQLAISALGDTLTITLPTSLIYSKISAVATMKVEYRNATNETTNSSVLVNKNATATQAAGSVAVTTASNEPVALPATAMATTNQLLTQSIIGSLTSVAPVSGDLVEAYMAKWVDTPAVTGITTTVTTGTIGGQTLLDSTAGGLAALIDASLNAATAAVPAVAGVNAAAAAVAAKPVPLYVVQGTNGTNADLPEVFDTLAAAVIASNNIIGFIKSAAQQAAHNGAMGTGAEHAYGGGGTASTNTTSVAAIASGVAKALAAVAGFGANLPNYTVSAARAAAIAPGATPASVAAAVLNTTTLAAVKTASLNPNNGVITGGVTGSLTLTKSAGTTASRGLVFIDGAGANKAAAGAVDGVGVAGPWASGVVGTVNGVANSYNLLLGIEPTTADLALKKNPGWFVILVHKPSTATTGADLNMLTSADPLATNFVPFAPNLISGLGTRTTLATTLAKLNKLAPVAGSTNWALYGLGSPSVVATAPAGNVASFPRRFVGLKTGGAVSTTFPASFWTNDAAGTDMAMTMAGNKVSVATELGSNLDTLSTITNASYVSGAAGLAWKNDAAASANEHIDVLQTTAAPAAGAIRVGAGWSLVTVPTGMVTAVPAAVGAIIKVGAQVNSGYTWIKASDAATTPVPALTAGEAVFVYSTAGGAIN